MSRFEDPVIITCSISGAIANRDQCPAIPYTPEEYAAEARRAVDEGASQIHIHARTPDGTPSYEIEDFAAITAAIRAEVGDVIVNYSTGAIGDPARQADRLPARAEARRRGAEHVVDELREVLATARRLRLQGRLREQLRHDHRADRGDEGERDPARARVLRRRPRRQPRSADPHGPARAAAADLARDGRDRRHPADAPQRDADGRPDPGRARGPEQLAGDRRLPRPVEAARELARPRRQRPGRARGQPLPAERRDGPLERRADREGRGRWPRTSAAGRRRVAEARELLGLERGGGEGDAPGVRRPARTRAPRPGRVWEGTKADLRAHRVELAGETIARLDDARERRRPRPRRSRAAVRRLAVGLPHALVHRAGARPPAPGRRATRDEAVGTLDGRPHHPRSGSPRRSSSRTIRAPRVLAELHREAHEHCYLAASVNFPVEVGG